MNVAISRISRKLAVHTNLRARQGRLIAAQMHRNAPRGGSNINVRGEKRSAEGEVPAPESRNLLRLIAKEPQRLSPYHYRFAVNYKKLEYGEDGIGPRPMGRYVLAEFKRLV